MMCWQKSARGTQSQKCPKRPRGLPQAKVESNKDLSSLCSHKSRHLGSLQNPLKDYLYCGHLRSMDSYLFLTDMNSIDQTLKRLDYKGNMWCITKISHSRGGMSQRFPVKNSKNAVTPWHMTTLPWGLLGMLAKVHLWGRILSTFSIRRSKSIRCQNKPKLRPLSCCTLWIYFIFFLRRTITFATRSQKGVMIC
jgi:hypothetical protein